MNKVKQFIIENSQEFSEAVAQGYSIIMREDEILEWMQKYADSEVKKLNETAVSKCDGIERRASLIAFIQEKIKNRDMNLYMNASELVDQMLERNL